VNVAVLLSPLAMFLVDRHGAAGNQARFQWRMPTACFSAFRANKERLWSQFVALNGDLNSG
jgi:hypothetical protein